MSDAELRDELVTLLLAGHETTATSVAWAIERLVRHPEKLARLLAEIDAGESEEYLMAVVHETLRVRPVVPLVVRVLAQEMQLGEHVLPAGTRVAPSIYLTNRNPARLRAARGVPPRALPRRPAGDVLVDPLRRRHPPLHRRLLRAAGDEADPAHDARRAAPGAARAGPAAGERIRRRAITLVPAAGARVVWERRAPGAAAT